MSKENLAFDASKYDVISLMTGAVPERADEISRMWAKYDPEVRFTPKLRGFNLHATGKYIAYDPVILDVFWLICFSGWKAFECYAPCVLRSIVNQSSVEECLRADSDLHAYESEYKARIRVAKDMLSSANQEQVQWPSDIPKINPSRDAYDCVQYKAAFDLTLIALAFTFFHEFSHVIFDCDDNRPNDLREEELACDVLAREFMTAKLMKYAKENQHDYQQILRKRAMGFALASLVIHEITPEFELGGNQQYFSFQTRMKAILENTQIDENDTFWCFTACLLVGIFRQRHISVDPLFTSSKALTHYLVEAI